MAKKSLTAALEERRKNREQKSIEVLGEEFTLPSSMPASLAVRFIALEAEGTKEIQPSFIIEIGEEILGKEQWSRLMEIISFDEIEIVFEAIMTEIMGEALGEENGTEGEAQKSGDSN